MRARKGAATNALILCFSQTGNTRKIAARIQEGIQEKADACEIRDLRDVDPAELPGYDLVGLGCPVFYFKEPFHVSDFIRGLPDAGGRHWFVFCTHGSVMGRTLVSMSEGLKRRGARVVGHHHCYADAWLPFYPYPTLTTGHPDPQEEEEARAFGRTVVERSRRIAAGEALDIPEPDPPPPEFEGDADMLTRPFMDQVMPRLSVNRDTCITCHTCEKFCPVDGIDVEADPPRIQDPCIYCWGCLNVCPSLAIEGDLSQLVAMAPDNYARYRKALDEAAARGEFRWRMDPASLNFEDPYMKQREREILLKKQAVD